MKEIEALNPQITIFRCADSWADLANRWSCSIEAGKEVKIQVRCVAPTMEEAVEAASFKFLQAVDLGISRAALSPPVELKAIDSDIPF